MSGNSDSPTRSFSSMSIFRSKVLSRLVLMSLITCAMLYINSRHLLSSHQDTAAVQGQLSEPNLEESRKKASNNIFNIFQFLKNVRDTNLRKLLEKKWSADAQINFRNEEISNASRDIYVTSGNTDSLRYIKERRSAVNASKKTIRIVLYHIYHTLLRWSAKDLDMTKCHHSSNCEIIHQGKCSNDPILADAVVFQGNNMPRDRPVRLNSDQVFVFLNIESPQYLQQVRLENPFFKDYFNWTMTYRRDSDIPYLYGSVLPRNTETNVYLSRAESSGVFLNFSTYHEHDSEDFDTYISEKDYYAIFRRKTKSSVWFVSHCGTASRRERYVSRMTEFTEIDTFGRCSNITNECPKKDLHCGENVKDTYKFIFAFENSLCEDYITEKVFRWFSEDIIVVVRGARYYSRYLPNGTYIDADDFSSPEELAKYLTQLGSDEEGYIKYLKRKDRYKTISEKEHIQLAYCNLCYKLNNLELYRKPAELLHQWWNIGKCTRPTF